MDWEQPGAQWIPGTLRRGAWSCARELRLAPGGALSSSSQPPRGGGWGLGRGEPCPAHPRTCLPWRLAGLSRRHCASPCPRPGAAPDLLIPAPAHPRTPSRASFQKAPVHSPAFFGRESRRFAASPEGGVYEADPYKYGAARRLPRRVARRSARAPLTGERSPPSLPCGEPLQGHEPMGGRGGRPARRGWSLGVLGVSEPICGCSGGSLRR